MTKVVYNACYGGFVLSNEAIRLYLKLKEIPFEERKDKYNNTMFCKPSGTDWSLYETIDRVNRTDPALVQVVETLGVKANGSCAKLRIVDIPEGTMYRIDEYDGFESVETRDNVDWSIA